MGRAASHITLECALQTHLNITIFGEEVAAKKQTLKNVTDYIVDIVCIRAGCGYNYGVILIPEGLIDFIPEVVHFKGSRKCLMLESWKFLSSSSNISDMLRLILASGRTKYDF